LLHTTIPHLLRAEIGRRPPEVGEKRQPPGEEPIEGRELLLLRGRALLPGTGRCLPEEGCADRCPAAQHAAPTQSARAAPRAVESKSKFSDADETRVGGGRGGANARVRGV
jgi:hypothetical protein